MEAKTLSLAGGVLTNATCQPETLPSSCKSRCYQYSTLNADEHLPTLTVFRVPEGRSQTEVCAEFTSKCGVLGDGDAQVMSTSCGYNQVSDGRHHDASQATVIDSPLPLSSQLHKYIIEGSCIMAHKHGKTWSYARNVSDGMNLDLVYSKLNKNCTELPMSPGWCHDETYNAEAPELCVPASK